MKSTQNTEGTSQLQNWNIESIDFERRRQIGEGTKGGGDKRSVYSRCE